MEVISWLIVQKLMMIFSVISGFWIVTGWRYIWIWRVYLIDPPNFWVSYRWPAGCIKRGKCHKHCKTIHTWGSWFRNWWNNISNVQLEIPVVYYSWTRAWEIVCTVYHKPIYSNLALLNANIFLCTPKKFKATAFMYAFFSIAYCFLSAECPLFSLIDLFWFYCFAKLIE